MALYTLIRNIETNNPKHQSMIERRRSPEVSGIIYDLSPNKRIDHVYSSEEEAAKDAELWNNQFEGANLVPAKVTLLGELKYRSKELWNGIVEEINSVNTIDEVMALKFYSYSALFAGGSLGNLLKTGVEQLVDKADPNIPLEKQLMVVGIASTCSLASYLTGRYIENQGLQPEN